MKSAPLSRSRIWRWPVVIAVLSVFGLLSALLGQGGVWWWLSWGALAVPLAVAAAAVLKADLRSF